MNTPNTIKKYFDWQEQLLRIEYEHEKSEYENLCRNVGINRRIRQGKCWYPLFAGRTAYNALDQLIIEVIAPDHLDISEHEFEPGRPVAFFHTAEKQDATEPIPQFLPYTCQVSRISDQRMHITIPHSQAAQVLRDYALQGVLGIQLAFDSTSHRVMREAIQTVRSTTSRRLIALRNILAGSQQPGFGSESPIRLPWLNASQETAVRKVLAAHDVAIVHGPPGTGKTTTMVEAISETLLRETQVLVCAQSNAAVDWISEQLMARGISVLRIGNPMRVSDNLLAATYEHRYEAHPAYIELWSIRKSLRELYSIASSKHLSETKRRANSNQIHNLRNRATELEIRINTDLFDNARVIASTLIGTASRVLERKRFSTLFIDEAAQAFEAACWAAIAKADRVILAGDHCQLPPTIKCNEAAHKGLQRTLMEKVVASKPSCVNLLTVQYRMHQDIMQFSSQWFYQSRLTADPLIADRRVFPLDTPIVWYDTAHLGFEEESNPLTQSRLNTAEANLLIKTLCEYVSQIGIDRLLDNRTDFGIISPYKSQVHLLRRLIKQTSSLRRLLPAITVHTVDGFQGQERDVVLISMVRGNDEGRIGFLNDLRRMNVALTRARMKLMILGDTGTLRQTPFYGRLIEYIAHKGELIELEA